MTLSFWSECNEAIESHPGGILSFSNEELQDDILRMHISKKQLNPIVEKKIKEIFHQLIADLKNKEDVAIFLRDFLTPVEYQALIKRLALALYLEKNRSYKEIQKTLKVSSATIAALQEMMDKRSEGFSIALQYIKTDKWAGGLAERISKTVKKITG